MDKPLEDRRIVRSDGVSKLTGLASATIYEAVSDRGSPPPVERRGERVCAGLTTRAPDILVGEGSGPTTYRKTNVSLGTTGAHAGAGQCRTGC